MTKSEILNKGKFLKTEYGISKYFEWRVYEVGKDRQRYRVSMFSNEVEHIGRTYCELCGEPTYKKSCCGQSLRYLQM